MWSWLRLTGLVCLLASPATAFAWTDLAGGDHFGEDWIPADGAVIGGTHTNVGAFLIEPGTTVAVVGFDGAGGWATRGPRL